MNNQVRRAMGGLSANNGALRNSQNDKLFYKIGEVSKITGLPSYVLRFWESEFDFLRPQKGRGRQRVYTQKDVETLVQIKRMRYEQGYTIEGLRRRWNTRQGTQERKPSRAALEVLKRVRHDLNEMLKVLNDQT
jgi:DNA-binding transcriptional MerR regulator